MAPKNPSQNDRSDRRSAAERRNDNRRAHDRFSPAEKARERRRGDRRNERD